MHLSKGYLPTFLAMPAAILAILGYIFAALYKFYDIEILSMGIAYPWLASFLGLYALGRTKEKFDDERINQVRNFSYRFLGDMFIYGIAALCILGFFFNLWGTIDGFPFFLLVILLGHLYYLKVAVLFDGIDEQTGKLKFAYHLLFFPYCFIVLILNFILFI